MNTDYNVRAGNAPPRDRQRSEGAKRLFDFAAAFFLGLATMPLWLLAAIGILVSDGRPVFYRAKRVGQFGRELAIYKFRTMRNRIGDAGPVITGPSDPRIFPFGNFLRLTKIDELPQLLNVLAGELSFVGPRPEDPRIVEKYYDKELMDSLAYLPGLTSAGTVHYMQNFATAVDDTNTEESYATNILKKKIAIDVAYEHNSSVVTDISLIFRTAIVVLGQLLGKARHD